MLTAVTSAWAAAASRSRSTTSNFTGADFETAPAGCFRAVAVISDPFSGFRPPGAAAAAVAPAIPLIVAAHRRPAYSACQY